MPRSPVFFSDKLETNGSFADATHKVNETQKRKPETALDAAETAGPREEWWIQVRGSAYGPYSAKQVRQFITEGRVRTNTLVARSREGRWVEARKEGAFADALTQARPDAANVNSAEPAKVANLFISAEIHSGAWNAFLAALERMGRVAELAPGFWLLRSPFSAGVIRNTLSQTLERGDRFVVIDATRDRLAWYNMGPGVDVAIREIWNAPIDTTKYQP